MAAVILRWERPALLSGIAGVLISIVGAWLELEQFYRSYLLSYTFWFAIALGSLPLVMLHHLVGGRWGFVSRRILEASTRTLPLMALLFVPVLLGIHHLYEWSHADVVAQDAILKHKSSYLNVTFFVIRAVGYFLIWTLLQWVLNRWSSEQDRTSEPGKMAALMRRFQLLSGPGIIVYALTISFASTDWLMSLEPHWFSTIYGLMFMIGQMLTALAFAIAMLGVIAQKPPIAGRLKPETLHDLGNLLFALLMVWAYLSFSQFLIIWSGNLPEEIPWYLRRSEGGWQWMAAFLAVFHFAIPFVLLLARRNKRRKNTLAIIAVSVVLMRFVDLTWLIVPAHEPSVHIHWLDIVTFISIGGLWLAAFARQLRLRPVLPLNDPEFGLEES
jgi:hypothetical protein